LTVVLFDLEGTLVQSIEDDLDSILEFRMKTREKLLELQIPANVLEGTMTSTLLRNKAHEYVNHCFNKDQTRHFRREMDRFLKQFELQWANRSNIFPDTLPALQKLKRLGYILGVFTNTSRDALNRMLSMHNIDTFFDVTITRDDILQLKPDPEGILLALKRLHARFFYFVGDLVHDMNATKAAGGTCVIVNRRPSKKLNFCADYMITSLQEVLRIVQSA
jgi:HAD superfamily hydrolase (TIGR01549 family)